MALIYARGKNYLDFEINRSVSGKAIKYPVIVPDVPRCYNQTDVTRDLQRDSRLALSI